MPQLVMYPGLANSPQTELAVAINDTVVTIPLVDATKVPVAPNIVTIGTDETAETILYTGKSGNNLTGVTRGFQGAARSWNAGVKVSRNFTSYDHDSARRNIEDLDARQVAHLADFTQFLNTRRGITEQSIINGNFSIAQERTMIKNPANVSYIMDQWRVHTGSGAPANITHSQATLTPGEIPGSQYAYLLQFDGAGSSPSDFRTAQPILNGTRLLCGAGKSITFGIMAKSNVPNKKLGVYLTQNYGSGGSPSAQENIAGSNITLTSNWTLYTFTIATNTLSGKTFGTNNDDFLQINLQYAWDVSNQAKVGASTPETFRQAGDIYFAQAAMNVGGTLLPFQPNSRQQDLLECMYFWEKSYNYSNQPGAAVGSGADYASTNDNANSGATFNCVTFKVKKRIPPTVTIYGIAGAISTINDGTADRALGAGQLAMNVGETGFQQNYTLSGATGSSRSFHYVADARL